MPREQPPYILGALVDIKRLEVMDMARTVIDLDDDLVVEVAGVLGTKTKKDTVNSALREVLQARRRAIALAELRASVAEGAIDVDLLLDKRSYRR